MKGLRIGTGPRGGYVRAGRGGIQYRRTLGHPVPAPTTPAAGVELQAPGAGNLTGEHVAALIDASVSEITRRISEAAALPKPRLLPNVFTYGRRKLEWLAERAVPLFYDLDSEVLACYEQVDSAADGLAQSAGRYYDVDEQAISGMQSLKGHSGASALLDRQELTVARCAPDVIALNFEPVALIGHRRAVYVLPDQILVEQGERYVSLNLKSIRIVTRTSRFITRSVPPGVQPVDQTWQYVNKSGGPDKRYKNNPQIPIIEVFEIDFHGESGFQFHTAFTDRTATEQFASAIRGLQEVLPTA